MREYMFCITGSKDPIYIGETNNLEETFANYVDNEFEGEECKQKTSVISKSLC